MVLTFDPLRVPPIAPAARWAPTVLTWSLLITVAILFAWVYVANPQPSPYGLCYASRGRPIPCVDVEKPTLSADALRPGGGVRMEATPHSPVPHRR